MKPIIVVCENFPIKYLDFFKTFVVDKSFLEKCKTLSKIPSQESWLEGELFYIRDDNIVQFLYNEPQLVYSINANKGGLPDSRENFIEDRALVQRILDIVVKYPNVTKQGLIQSLSIDYPSELVEYILNELIEKGYIVVEIEKTKTGAFSKLSISMNGRTLLSKKEVEGN
ncbi:MAG: hypothetical protein H5T50_00145 [Nitrososphaeria archaeon]|nr:hypothetical protein [Nitrososphaeria archaeon]